MKTHSSDLFDLVKSLIPSEKRFFKLQANFHKGNKNYIELFDAIDKLEAYDEGKLRQKIRNKKVLKNIAFEKVHLYNQILKVLRIYHSEKHIEDMLDDMIRNISILYEKGLYSQAYKIIRKAKKLAEENEHFLQLTHILNIEEKLQNILAELSDLRSISESTLNQKISALEKELNAVKYQDLLLKERKLFVRKGFLKDAKQNIDFDTILDHPLLKDTKMALSNKARNTFLNVFSLYNVASNNYATASEFYRQKVELMEQYPDLIRMDPIVYLKDINMLGFLDLLTGKHQEVPAFVDKIRKMPFFSSLIGEVNKSLYAYNLELVYHIDRGFFDRILPIIREMEKIRNGNDDKILMQLKIFNSYYIAYYYFIVQNYGQSLDWINKTLSLIKRNVREDLSGSLRIMNIIIHYELGHNRLLRYTLKSTSDHLSKSGSLSKYEQIILSTIRTLLKRNYSSDELTSLFKDLREQLRPLTHDQYEKMAFFNFDAISWLTGKIERKPMAEVMREKKTKKT